MQSTISYTYGDSSWKDLLTNYNGTAITYDEIGNPETIGDKTLTWKGRKLISYTDEGISVSYGYNADGIRTYKEINNGGQIERHEYVLSGSQIVKETVFVNGVEQYILVYVYDELGAPIGIKYRTPSYAENVYTCYFFEKNLQGDVVAIYNSAGTKIGTYTYDAWGNGGATMLNASGVDRLILLSYNPFRYRGYYYDTDSGWYYLQSRYYNPTWGRFLNADTYVNANGDMIGYNMFAYCSNNPIMEIDPTGEVILSTLLIGAFVGLVVNTTASIVVQGITNGWENIDANQVVFDGLMGAVSGAVGASGIGAVGSIIIGGALNVVGSIGSDLIASDGDWSTVNIGKALVMGAVGAGLGKWAGAGAQNTKAMCNAVNMGKSWGAKMFNAFCGSVSDQGMSQLTRQTAALYMRNAVLGYKVQAITSTAISLIGSAMAGTFFNIFD